MDPADIFLFISPQTLQLAGPLGRVDVSDRDCALLKAFVASPDRRLSRASLLEEDGKPADARVRRAFEVRIVRLRKKLAQAGASAPTIKAIRGGGYQLCVPLAVAPIDLPTGAPVPFAPPLPR